MSYRCEVCGVVRGRGKARLTHCIHRAVVGPPAIDQDGKRRPSVRQEIARELAVCEWCHEALAHGSTVAELVRLRRPKAPPPHTVSNAPVDRPPALPPSPPIEAEGETVELGSRPNVAPAHRPSLDAKAAEEALKRGGRKGGPLR